MILITAPESRPAVNPCLPNPCGPNAMCRDVNNRAECSCLEGMFGAPPNCRPECVINQDCPSNRACIRQRCEDPCIGTCGFNALCNTQHHQPKCSCLDGYEGDPYTGCHMHQSEYILFHYLQSIRRGRLHYCDAPQPPICLVNVKCFFQWYYRLRVYGSHFMHVLCIVYISFHHSFIYLYLVPTKI